MLIQKMIKNYIYFSRKLKTSFDVKDGEPWLKIRSLMEHSPLFPFPKQKIVKVNSATSFNDKKS